MATKLQPKNLNNNYRKKTTNMHETRRYETKAWFRHLTSDHETDGAYSTAPRTSMRHMANYRNITLMHSPEMTRIMTRYQSADQQVSQQYHSRCESRHQTYLAPALQPSASRGCQGPMLSRSSVATENINSDVNSSASRLRQYRQ